MRTSSWTLLAGRAMFGSLFVLSGLNHFSIETIAAASLNGVPAAVLLVPASGLLCVFGGVSAALGWRTRLGATALALFLVPVTLFVHHFWDLASSQAALAQQAQFMKNVALLGAALVLRELGPGPLSVDDFRRRRSF